MTEPRCNYPKIARLGPYKGYSNGLCMRPATHQLEDDRFSPPVGLCPRHAAAVVRHNNNRSMVTPLKG